MVSMATVDDITRHEDAEPDDPVWVGAPPVVAEIVIVDADPAWPGVFDNVAQRIRDALGDRVLTIEHVGSTSVPGLAAKPIIDIDLTVADSSDEARYLPARGHRLRAAGPGTVVAPAPVSRPGCSAGESATCGARTAPRRSATGCSATGCGAIPTIATRMRRRNAWRRRRRTPMRETMMAYNLRKQPVIRDILDRMFRAHGML